ncbi:MAG: hypothetical protein A3F75_13320 [Betaproteobacteria bacterium RIFCSPLOWO2_12_FULL_64_23]|nr:MAG: hypothetical protein A3F75_13320 [Betaproteobacteria bacterium RIFCSPLOWO2_12_FULL_64_23]
MGDFKSEYRKMPTIMMSDYWEHITPNAVELFLGCRTVAQSFSIQRDRLRHLNGARRRTTRLRLTGQRLQMRMIGIY